MHEGRPLPSAYCLLLLAPPILVVLHSEGDELPPP